MKQNIDVEGLPEGWKAVSIDATGCNFDSGLTSYPVHLKVERIQPRRIVLEETEEERSVSYGDWYEDDLGRVSQWLNKNYGSSRCVKIWKQVKE